jgi:hypothetical protein
MLSPAKCGFPSSETVVNPRYQTAEYHLEIKKTALLLAGLGLDVRIAFLDGPDSFG